MKPTSSLMTQAFRKLRLTTKDANKGFYKGTRTGSMGRHTKFGGYTLEWHKVRHFVVPEGLAKCTLTPFVSEKVRPKHGDYKDTGDANGPRSTSLFLSRWKDENGFD